MVDESNYCSRDEEEGGNFIKVPGTKSAVVIDAKDGREYRNSSEELM